MLAAVGVVAIAPISGTSRGLHVSRLPGFGADSTQKGGGMKGPCADLHIEWLQDHTPLFRPILLKGQYDLLEADSLVWFVRIQDFLLALLHKSNCAQYLGQKRHPAACAPEGT